MPSLGEFLQPLAAIAGGAARGMIDAEMLRQQQEQQALLQAMRVAQFQTEQENAGLQQTLWRQQIAGYEPPAVARERETARQKELMRYQTEQGLAATRQELDWKLALQREMEAQARQAAETQMRLELLGAGVTEVPTEWATTAVPPPQVTPGMATDLRAPAPLPEPGQRQTLPSGTTRTLPPETEPAEPELAVETQAEVPTRPEAARAPGREGVAHIPVSEANYEQLLIAAAANPYVKFARDGGMVVADLPSRAEMRELEREEEAARLRLQQARSEIEETKARRELLEVQAKRTEAETDAVIAQTLVDMQMAPLEERQKLLEIAVTEFALEAKKQQQPLNMELLRAQIAQTQQELASARSEEERKQLAMKYVVQMLSSDNEQERQLALSYLLGFGYNINEIGAVAARLEEQGLLTQTQVAEIYKELGEIRASANIEVARERGQTERGVAPLAPGFVNGFNPDAG